MDVGDGSYCDDWVNGRGWMVEMVTVEVGQTLKKRLNERMMDNFDEREA